MGLESVRQPGYPNGTRGFASPDCSEFAFFKTDACLRLTFLY